MKRLLDNYVYENLRKFKNALISEEEYKKLGEKRILEDLKREGFDCEIYIYNHYYNELTCLTTKRMQVESVDIVIWIK